MTPEEFQRLKEEEKKHLRQMRDLKQTYRETQRKKSVLDALTGMRSAELESETGALSDRLQQDAALQEARMELALEREDEIAKAEDDRDAIRKAEAEELIRQMKAEVGSAPPDAPAPAESSSATETSPQAAKTIGRPPPSTDAENAPAPDVPAKTIGRSGGQ